MPLQLKKKDNPDYISMGYQDSTMYLGKKILLNPAFCQVTVFLNLYSEVRKTEKQLLFFFHSAIWPEAPTLTDGQ